MPAVNDIRVVSLHYFEDETFKEGKFQFFSLPKVKVDTQQRCAAMVIYDNRLAVMPFKRGSMLDDDDEPVPNSTA
jgi:cleavage and polyadenylation specificity factor subunit 1